MPAGRRPAGGRRGDRTGRDPKGPRIRGGGPPRRAFPRVDLVFLCDYNGVLGHVALYGARNQTGWEWLDIKTLPRQPLYLPNCAGKSAGSTVMSLTRRIWDVRSQVIRNGANRRVYQPGRMPPAGYLCRPPALGRLAGEL